ncbi:MAG: FtsX-like permease family protein [Alphaproteobacteria bacterium]
MIRALDRKLLRDLWRLRGQATAVALVVASGVALLVMSLSAVSSLRATKDAFYDRYGFADVFAAVKRAPERLGERIAAIPGVRAAETRIAAFATLDVADMAEPVIGQLVSLPERSGGGLNRLALRSGRLPDPARPDEVVLHEPFAEAHGLGLGGGLRVLMNGRLREVRVVGIALSPEFVYAIAPGMLMPDEARYGVVWMNRDALAAAFDLDGAFNSVTLALLRGADPAEVIDRLDPLLERYGGTGAIARKDQISNWFLENELQQLKTMATILPTIFLAVAAFLTNTVLARLIAMERREISLMKAFGYSNFSIGGHYAGMAAAMAAIGVVVGWAAGLGLGRYNTEVYSQLFRFPFLHFRPSAAEFAISAGVSLGAALFGALWAVRGAVALPPAEAMRPPAPENFRSARLPRWLARRLDNQTRMILRQILRAPVRSSLTVGGVALAIAVLAMAMQWSGTITHLVESYFEDTQRQDISVGFFDPLPNEAKAALARLPGVLRVEPMRQVSAEISYGRVTHRGAVTGLTPDAILQVVDDVRGWTLPVPEGGVALGSTLAEKLGVDVGDRVEVRVLEGARKRLELQVAGVFETNIGTPAYMELELLNRAIAEPARFTQANLLIDKSRADELYRALKGSPVVASVVVKQSAIDKFYDTLGETLLVFVSFFVVFAGALAIGVAYNAARIALSERGRELATLRVLGFTRGEIAYILLGETAVLTLVAAPIGCLAGAALIWLMSRAFATELFRVPYATDPSAFGWAVLIALAAAAGAALLVRRRLDSLDLIAVLKTRE